MKIYIYGHSSTGKSIWVKSIGGTELSSLPKPNKIKKYPYIYVYNEKLSEELEKSFDVILNFSKESIMVEKVDKLDMGYIYILFGRENTPKSDDMNRVVEDTKDQENKFICLCNCWKYLLNYTRI